MSSSSALQDVTLFTSNHLFVRVTDTLTSMESSSEILLEAPTTLHIDDLQSLVSSSKGVSRDCQVGLTTHGSDEIGDVDRVAVKCDEQSDVDRGQLVLSLDWTGYKITTADELYHTGNH